MRHSANGTPYVDERHLRRSYHTVTWRLRERRPDFSSPWANGLDYYEPSRMWRCCFPHGSRPIALQIPANGADLGCASGSFRSAPKIITASLSDASQLPLLGRARCVSTHTTFLPVEQLRPTRFQEIRLHHSLALYINDAAPF